LTEASERCLYGVDSVFHDTIRYSKCIYGHDQEGPMSKEKEEKKKIIYTALVNGHPALPVLT
jgi:hypothetical protein